MMHLLKIPLGIYLGPLNSIGNPRKIREQEIDVKEERYREPVFRIRNVCYGSRYADPYHRDNTDQDPVAFKCLQKTTFYVFCLYNLP